MKKISVIIPIYNSELFLDECLNSVVNQTYSNFEIILINDGSTDNSLSICKKYQSKYKNIIIIDQNNHGQGYARNIGIKKSKGHYVTFIDSDDWVSNNLLRKMYDFSENGNVDVVVADIYKNKNGKNSYFSNFQKLSTNDNTNLIISHPGPVCKLIKKSIFTDNELFFPEGLFYEDLGTMPMLGVYARKIVNIEEGLYYYRIRENSTMQQKVFNPKLDDIFIIMEILESFFKGNKKYDEELEYLYIEHLLYSASLRYLEYKETLKSQISKIYDIINLNFPEWNSNLLYEKRNIKFKLITKLIFKKKYRTVRFLKLIGGK